MSDPFSRSEAQRRQSTPSFPLAHGGPRGDARRGGAGCFMESAPVRTRRIRPRPGRGKLPTDGASLWGGSSGDL